MLTLSEVLDILRETAGERLSQQVLLLLAVRQREVPGTCLTVDGLHAQLSPMIGSTDGIVTVLGLDDSPVVEGNIIEDILRVGLLKYRFLSKRNPLFINRFKKMVISYMDLKLWKKKIYS